MRPRKQDKNKKKVVDDYEQPAMMGQRVVTKQGRVLISDNHAENKKNRAKLRTQKLLDFRKQEIEIFEELEDQMMRDVDGSGGGKFGVMNDDGDIELTLAQVFGEDPFTFNMKREKNKSNRAFT